MWVAKTRKYISHRPLGPPLQPSLQVPLCCSGLPDLRIPYQERQNLEGSPMVRLLHFRLILALMVMTASSWATTYYISTSGSDSNSGTSTSSPWQHAPGMSGCTSNCASKSPAAGDRFIFKGGDTWHYSASLGTKGLPWTITGGNGTSSSQIYYGVDVTFYNSNVCGSSWCRPKLDSDNVPANGGNPLVKYSVSSLIEAEEMIL